MFNLPNTQTTTFAPASFFQMLGLKILKFPPKLYDLKNKIDECGSNGVNSRGSRWGEEIVACELENLRNTSLTSQLVTKQAYTIRFCPNFLSIRKQK